MDKLVPLSANELVGSIISLDKCKFSFFPYFFFVNSNSLLLVFEEKSLNESQGFSGEVITGDCLISPVEIIDPTNRKVIVATRHYRNDSRSIQLENRYLDGMAVDAGGPPMFTRPRKHYRSNSCDVKLGRSNSRDSDNTEYRMRRLMRGHSRNNSRDLEHEGNRQAQVPPQNYNIRYILNHLKTNSTAEQNLANLKNNFKNRRHIRNHSEPFSLSFLPNNAIVRLDNNCANQFLQSTCGGGGSFKHSRDYHEMLKNNTAKLLLSKNSSVEMNEELEQKYTSSSHSRTNSKDLSTKITNSLKSLIEDGSSNLRHRRTNSKDLKAESCENKRTLSAKNSNAGNVVDKQQTEAERQLLFKDSEATTAGEDSEATEL